MSKLRRAAIGFGIFLGILETLLLFLRALLPRRSGIEFYIPRVGKDFYDPRIRRSR